MQCLVPQLRMDAALDARLSDVSGGNVIPTWSPGVDIFQRQENGGVCLPPPLRCGSPVDQVDQRVVGLNEVRGLSSRVLVVSA